jgi:uncharacterized membrane protein
LIKIEQGPVVQSWIWLAPTPISTSVHLKTLENKTCIDPEKILENYLHVTTYLANTSICLFLTTLCSSMVTAA